MPGRLTEQERNDLYSKISNQTQKTMIDQRRYCPQRCLGCYGHLGFSCIGKSAVDPSRAIVVMDKKGYGPIHVIPNQFINKIPSDCPFFRE